MTGWKIHFFGYNSPTDCLTGTKFCTKTQNLMVKHNNFFGKFMIADRFAPKNFTYTDSTIYRQDPSGQYTCLMLYECTVGYATTRKPRVLFDE